MECLSKFNGRPILPNYYECENALQDMCNVLNFPELKIFLDLLMKVGDILKGEAMTKNKRRKPTETPEQIEARRQRDRTYSANLVNDFLKVLIKNKKS